MRNRFRFPIGSVFSAVFALAVLAIPVAPVAAAQSSTLNVPVHNFPVGITTFGKAPRAGTQFSNITVDVDASNWTNPGTVGLTLQASFDGGNTFRTLAGAVIDGPPPWVFKGISSSTIHLNWVGDPPMSPDALQILLDNETGAPVRLGPDTITWNS